MSKVQDNVFTDLTNNFDFPEPFFCFQRFFRQENGILCHQSFVEVFQCSALSGSLHLLELQRRYWCHFPQPVLEFSFNNPSLIITRQFQLFFFISAAKLLFNHTNPPPTPYSVKVIIMKNGSLQLCQFQTCFYRLMSKTNSMLPQQLEAIGSHACNYSKKTIL